MTTFAVCKASYSWIPIPTSPGRAKPNAVGGYCGAAFFVNSSTAISALHVLNSPTFKPNHGRNHAQVWIISPDNHIVEINESMIDPYPDLDLAILNIKDSLPRSVQLKLASEAPEQGEKIYNLGYPNTGSPNVNFSVNNSTLGQPKIDLTGGNLNSDIIRSNGVIDSIEKESVMANDMSLNNVEIIRTSYGGSVGMSGGPLIRQRDQNVVGFMSHGYPPDKTDKNVLCAISVTEFRNHI
ncbi:S1 family peptidase [Fodinibius sp. AD559]|uniref:S1 family peptidase n=1 Tax=Fodinibius sp. AD559 TaxID=3424179 RepID=UPI0040468981